MGTLDDCFYVSELIRTHMIMISAGAHDERDEVVSGDNSGKGVIHVNRDKSYSDFDWIFIDTKIACILFSIHQSTTFTVIQTVEFNIDI